MRKKNTIILIILINIISINILFGQSQVKQIATYNQNNFEKNKVFNETYSFWNKKHNRNLSSLLKDSTEGSYFTDDRNYKGLLNYGITFRSKTFKNFNFIEHLSMCFLRVEITKCTFTPKDSIIAIEGFINSNWDWGSNQLIKSKIEKNTIDIFLGEKRDTIRTCHLGRTANRDSVAIKLNNRETTIFTVLDTFPAFYFKKYSHYKTIPNTGKFSFKINGKVTKNTLLAFGSLDSFSEIFDLGSMIYNPEKNKKNKIIRRENYDCVPLITSNKLVADIEKEKAQKQETTYYTYTQNAENYILSRQYGKAKEQYNLLAQKYPILFARDIHNAIRCAILSRDLKAAFLWSEKLALKGIELSYFNAKIFNGLRKNPQWKNFSTTYDSICKIAKSKWNLPLKKELDDLLNEDQSDYGLENRKKPKVLYETTERVTSKLIDLIKREGFPSEEKIGSYTLKDTVLISFPDFNILFLHAEQQKPDNLSILNQLLNENSNAIAYDKKRSSNNNDQFNSCFRIYKGNLYNSKSCSMNNNLEVRKISFKFNNPYSFIMDYGNFVVEAHDSKNQEEIDEDYRENYNLIMKLTDDWSFYDKY